VKGGAASQSRVRKIFSSPRLGRAFASEKKNKVKEPSKWPIHLPHLRPTQLPAEVILEGSWTFGSFAGSALRCIIGLFKALGRAGVFAETCFGVGTCFHRWLVAAGSARRTRRRREHLQRNVPWTFTSRQPATMPLQTTVSRLHDHWFRLKPP